MSAEKVQASIQADPREREGVPGPAVAGAPRVADRLIAAPFLPPQPVAATPLAGTTADVLDPRSIASEHFRILATRLQMSLPTRRPACIGVVSAAAGEGKTTVSLGLAHALTRTVATRVGLLDLDLRRPSLARYLGLEAAGGVGEWLDERSEGIQLLRPAYADFGVAVGGSLASGRYELLGSPRMVNALEAARRAFDFTLLDLPPLMAVADAVTIQDHIDGFVLVVRSRHCPTETIQAAVSRLREGALLGVVLNDHREVIPGYHSYASRRYGDHGQG